MCKVYIFFKKLKRSKERKTDIWKMMTIHGDQLGIIKFDGAWRQYVSEPDIGTKWSHGCHDQISAFLKKQNELWRKKLKQKSV